MRHWFFTWVCCGLPFVYCEAQTQKIDDLKKAVLRSNNEHQKIAAVFALCEERASLPTDTLSYYSTLAKTLAEKTGNKKERLLADYYLASCLVKKGLLDSSMQLLDKHYASLQQGTYGDELQNKYAYVKGQILIKANRHKEALEVYYHSLARAEKAHDTLAQIISKNSIGWVYMELDQNREAINWFHKAVNTTGNTTYFEKYSLAHSNMAATYNTIGKNDSAEYFVKQSLYYARVQQNLQSIANSLAIQADIFIDTKRSALAEASLNEALQIRKQIGDPFYIVSDMTQLAIYYAHNNQPRKGIALCKEGIVLANEYSLSSKLSILYSALAENYKAAGNFELYSETLLKLLAVKDSLYKTASAEALADLQTKYELQKKENTIIQQKLDLVSKNSLIYGSLGLLVIAIIASVIIFTQYKKRQGLKLRLMQEEESRKSEKAVMSAEEAERKRIAADLHDSLGAYAASIASNIDHLQQHSIADNKVVLKELGANARSIVSQLSDTIWVLKKDTLSLTAISDRLKLFIQRIAPSYPSVTIDVIEEIETDHSLAPSHAFHLFQIIKEAINNALRHSRCRQIIIKVEAKNEWRLIITDNGSGFMQSTTVAEGGNGLMNMKARAKESGWKIQWQANLPKGTSVIIEPTTN